MKLPFSALALAFTLAATGHAATVTTDPVGFVTVSVAAGKTKAFALPLTNAPAFHGAVNSATSSTITTTGAGWQSNSFIPYDSNPHAVRFMSGSLAGLFFKITDQSGNTLTIATNGVDLTASTTANDVYDIVPVDTLGDLFGKNAASAGFVVSDDIQNADRVMIQGGSGWITYFNNGAKWLQDGDGDTDHSADALFPDRGFQIVRKSNTATLSLTITGNVATVNAGSKVKGSRRTLLANQLPVATTLSQFGLQNQPGWVSGTNVANADRIQVRGGSGWSVYLYNGTNFVEEGTSDPVDPAIPAGTSILVVRKGSTEVTSTQVLPYSL